VAVSRGCEIQSENTLIRKQCFLISHSLNFLRAQTRPKIQATPLAEAVAKKHGFSSLAQYDNVSMNITMIIPGIDLQTKKFTEPPEQIKNEIAALKQIPLG
jgi:hypothetical protein